MTAAQVFALAMQCTSVDPHLVLSIAQRESGLDPAIVHMNTNGTRDFGLLQINESNFGLLHLTPSSALDPCQSIRAAGDLISILSRYNSGSPTRSTGYALRVMDTLDTTRSDRLPEAATGSNDQQHPPACDRTVDAWANDPCKPPDQDFVRHYGDQQ